MLSVNLPMVDLVKRLFNIVCRESIEIYSFEAGFYGLRDMPKEFRWAIVKTLRDSPGLFCFLDNILIVSSVLLSDHNAVVKEVIHSLHNKNFASNFWLYEFTFIKTTWTRFEIKKNTRQNLKKAKISVFLNLEPAKILKQLRLFAVVRN